MPKLVNGTTMYYPGEVDQRVFEAQVNARAEGVLEGKATENAACASICDNYDDTGTSPVAVDIGQQIRARVAPNE